MNSDLQFDINSKKIYIPEGTKIITDSMFKNFLNLEEIVLPDSIIAIGSEAFYNCKNLKKIVLPNNLLTIRDKAFFSCKSIKEINIPRNCINIGNAAFALTSSLKKITVDEDNNYFTTVDNNILISNDGHVIQYACANRMRKVSLGYYWHNLINEKHGNILIRSIGDYAFNGAKYLKEISINSELTHIGTKVFDDCKKLKTLKLFSTYNGSSILLNTSKLEKSEIPFENIIIENGIGELSSNLSYLFKNAKYIKLPKTIRSISNNVFSKSSKLKTINIPFSINTISPLAFNPNTNLKFDKNMIINAKNFNMLNTRSGDEYDDEIIKILSLNDGTYYIKISNFDMIKITENDILNISNDFTYLNNDIEDFTIYLYDLLSINQNSNIGNMIINIYTNPKLKELYKKLKKDEICINTIIDKKINKSILKINKTNEEKSKFLFLSYVYKNDRKSDVLDLIKNYSISLNRFLKFCKFKNNNAVEFLYTNKIINYCDLLQRYNKHDVFLNNLIFFENVSFDNQKLLIKYFNKNIKNLLITSKSLDSSSFSDLNDLLKLCNILGIFSDNEILSQKMTTFVIEKLMNKDNKIFGNTIHSIFNEINPRSELDYEFIEFFIDNYKELIKIEKTNSGTISRIYNNFREISNTSSSHRGNQKHLKVTIDKCLDYFSLKKFYGVSISNMELAKFLQKYYSESDTLMIAEKIIEESKNAPRNIFTKDNNPCNDLKEKINDDYSFEWLPKQDWNNLILGKYCNCCAHIKGAGQGIMRASMILDNCQNLVVRDNVGNIISKATLYVNKDEGYAVFNTVETSLAHRSNDELLKIYKAILRGTKSFLKTYNKNNIKNPIKTISVGTNRNSIIEYLDKAHISIEEKEAINFGNYSLKSNGYSGDWKGKQKLLLRDDENGR